MNAMATGVGVMSKADPYINHKHTGRWYGHPIHIPILILLLIAQSCTSTIIGSLSTAKVWNQVVHILSHASLMQLVKWNRNIKWGCPDIYDLWNCPLVSHAICGISLFTFHGGCVTLPTDDAKCWGCQALILMMMITQICYPAAVCKCSRAAVPHDTH